MRHTRGPWLRGNWTILEEDRKAQLLGEAYWTFEQSKYGNDFARGPFGRKAMKPERIIDAAGYEAEFAYFDNEADENLFLSAPELLQAIKDMLPWFCQNTEMPDCKISVIDVLKLISKAEGKL